MKQPLSLQYDIRKKRGTNQGVEVYRLIRTDTLAISSTPGLIAAWVYFTLLIATVPAHAADWYRVEVILFAYTEPASGGEFWYENPGLPARQQTIALITETTDPLPGADPGAQDEQELAPYVALPERGYRLAGARRALASSRAHRPLLHVAWQQPGLDAGNVRAVRLDNTRLEKKTPKQAKPEPAKPEQGEPGQGEAWEPPEYTPPVKVFDGHVRLRRSRFLHLDVDFAYFPDTLEQPDLELPEQASRYRWSRANYVRLTESRRIKLEELNYFDHPLFGLIIQVSPIEIEE